VSVLFASTEAVVKVVTEAEAARILIEKAGAPHLDKKISVLATRMMLQVFSVPSLMAYLADAAVVPTGKPDGSVKVQLDFIKLPKEILPELEKLLSADYFKDHKLLKYIKNGQARTGLEIEVTPKDLPGTAYDYAY
jgi:hypothetical protein